MLGRIADYSDWRRAEQRERADSSRSRPTSTSPRRRRSSPSTSTTSDAPPEVVAALLDVLRRDDGGRPARRRRRRRATVADGDRIPGGGQGAASAGRPHRRRRRRARPRRRRRRRGARSPTMREHLGDDAARVIVQRMVPPGVDIRVRVRDDDRVSGPVISVGLGGLQADAIGDEASRLAPVSPSSAATMIASHACGGALDEVADRAAGRRSSRVSPNSRPTIPRSPSSTSTRSSSATTVLGRRRHDSRCADSDRAGPVPRRLGRPSRSR